MTRWGRTRHSDAQVDLDRARALRELDHACVKRFPAPPPPEGEILPKTGFKAPGKRSVARRKQR